MSLVIDSNLEYLQNILHISKVTFEEKYANMSVDEIIEAEAAQGNQQAIELAQEMIGEPVEVIDSFFQEAPVDAKPLWFLGKSLELLSGADVAYFAQGWEDARGCVIEHDSALAYGIKSIVA